MTEVTILMCDGPTCTAQKDKPELGKENWIDLSDWGADRDHRHFHFCSWTCVEQFSDAKVASP